jgi:hypothetical protein
VGIHRKPRSGPSGIVAALVGVPPEFRISLKIGDHRPSGGTIWQVREKLRAPRLRGSLPDLSGIADHQGNGEHLYVAAVEV